ncbi:MAG: DUF4129 domain-containing protein [Chloroflexota bacterium]|nr:MAG: DUF4129 domain-containing protein [Chloroflexota bacterium]
MTNIKSAFVYNEKTSSLINQGLIAAMLACLAVALKQLAERLYPGWNGDFLPWICLFIAIEAMYTRRITLRKADLYTHELVYRLVEWVVLLVLIKLILYGIHGFDILAGDIVRWQENFIVYFFTGEYAFTVLVSFIIWLMATFFGSAAADLEGDAIILYEDDLSGYISDRGATRRWLMTGIFSIGFVMVIITAMLHRDIELLWGNHPAPRESVVNVVLFFILGLALLSQSHLAIRRAAWAFERIPIQPEIARRWAVFSLVFLAGIALIALLLPTSYTLDFLSTAKYVLEFVFKLMSFLVMLLIFPLVFFFAYILSLFSTNRQEEPGQAMPAMPTPPTLQGGEGAPAWWEVVKSVIFWGVFIGIILYAFYQYLRQNQAALELLKRLPFVVFLMRLWRWLAEGLRGLNRKLGAAVQSGMERLRQRVRGTGVLSPPGYISLRRLSPRQRVMFFYYAMVRRGGESGIPRRPSQTPYEYAQSLKTGLTDADSNEALGTMTDAFIEARYSQHDISLEHANLVRRYWERIKKALRSLRR